MELRGNWNELIAGVGIKIADVFNQTQEQYKPGIFQVLNRLSGTGAQRTVGSKTGIGEVARFEDGDDLAQRNRYKSYNTTVVYNNYGGYIEVSKNTIEDRDFESIFSETRELSEGISFSQDKSGMQLFNGGFATTIDVNGYRMSWYGDGEPLFSTVHSTPVPGASTQSNASSTGIAFSHDNLETAKLALINQLSDDGQPLTDGGMDTLVLPPELQKEALEITQSSLVPNSANNAINVYAGGMATNMVVSKLLNSTNGGSNTAWFLVSQGRHKLNHEVRQEPQLNQGRSIKNLAVTFTADARWANSVTDWRRTWGSKGDLGSYSS